MTYDFTTLSDEELNRLLADTEDRMMTMAFTHGPGNPDYLEIHRKLDALVDEDIRRMNVNKL